MSEEDPRHRAVGYVAGTGQPMPYVVSALVEWFADGRREDVGIPGDRIVLVQQRSVTDPALDREVVRKFRDGASIDDLRDEYPETDIDRVLREELSS